MIIFTIILYRPFLALTFNEMKAQTLCMSLKLSQAALLTLLSLSIVASFQAIGTLLVFGLLVAPPATATLLVKRVPLVMLVSIIVGFIAVVAGLLISFHYGTSGGATMAVISVLEFFVVMISQSVFRRFRKNNSSSSENRNYDKCALAR
mgnify:FL=1